MIIKITWEAEYAQEIERAVKARLDGNEGMARVCARRAAGIVVGEYLSRHGITEVGSSLYDRLALLDGMPGFDEMIKKVCRHFLIKVDQEHNLPVGTDLIQDAAWLKEALLVGNNL